MPYADPNNPKRKAYLKKYYKSNQKHRNEYKRMWRKKNWERYLAQRRRWSRRPNGIVINLRNRLKRRGKSLQFTDKEFIKWYEKQKEACYYCGRTKDQFEKRYKNFSIDRKDNDIGYTLGNIVLCCFKCNTIKNDFFSAEEMKEIADKYIKPKALVDYN